MSVSGVQSMTSQNVTANETANFTLAEANKTMAEFKDLKSSESMNSMDTSTIHNIVNKVIDEQDGDSEISDISKTIQTEDEKEAKMLGEIRNQKEQE